MTESLLAWQEMLRWSLPRLSVWSQPQRLGTLSVHFLCTFISQAAMEGVGSNVSCTSEAVESIEKNILFTISLYFYDFLYL